LLTLLFSDQSLGRILAEAVAGMLAADHGSTELGRSSRTSRSSARLGHTGVLPLLRSSRGGSSSSVLGLAILLLSTGLAHPGAASGRVAWGRVCLAGCFGSTGGFLGRESLRGGSDEAAARRRRHRPRAVPELARFHCSASCNQLCIVTAK